MALILLAALSVGKEAIKDKLTLLLGVLAMLSIVFLGIHPIFVIISGGIIGLIIMKIMPDKAEEIVKEEVKGK